MTKIEHWTLEDVRNVSDTKQAFEDGDLDRPVLAWWTNAHGDRVEYRLNSAQFSRNNDDREVVEVDLSDFDGDVVEADESDLKLHADHEVEAYLDDLEELVGYPIDESETRIEEYTIDREDEVVTVTVAVTHDIPKYQSAAFIPDSAAEEHSLEELDRAEYDLAARGYIIGEFDAREPARRACVNFLTEKASDDQLGYEAEDEAEAEGDSEAPAEDDDEELIPRDVMAERLADRNTKAELYEKAEAEGIDVAKRWTKDEMIEAILDEKEQEMREQMAAQ